MSAAMIRNLCIISLVAASCLGSPISPRILGGSDADIADVPYILSIEYMNNHSCGGAIISADWALTDAWCALNPIDVLDFTVRSGSTLLGNGTLHNVTQWIRHPQYDFTNRVYDFALVQVDPPFEFGENVAAVTLPEQEQGTLNGAEAIIVGWGQVNGTDDYTSNQLQSGSTNVYGEAECSNILESVYQNSQLCVQDVNGQVAHCFRDEGGPLVINGTVYGVAPFPGTCADPLIVTIFARVASVRTWIDETIGVTP